MSLLSIFNKQEELLAIDIGSGTVKMLEMTGSLAQPVLQSFAIQTLEMEIFANNAIAKPEHLAEVIGKLCESTQIEGKRVIASLPAPAVFTKRIKMPNQGMDQLRDSVQFEAANFIPHKIEAVKLDFAVLGEAAKNQLDILVVAVKKELLEALEDCLALAGLEYAIADVDFFALHNVFQGNYPDLSESTSAVLNIGQRYTSICISKGGIPLFVGDVSIGLQQLAEELSLKLSIPEAQARSALQTFNFSPDWESVTSAFVEQSAQEISRQLSFFWNTCGVDGSISKIFAAGGGTLLPGLLDAIGRKSGIPCERLNPFAKVTIGDQVDKAYLEKVSPLFAVAAGLGMRSL